MDQFHCGILPHLNYPWKDFDFGVLFIRLSVRDLIDDNTIIDF